MQIALVQRMLYRCPMYSDMYMSMYMSHVPVHVLFEWETMLHGPCPEDCHCYALLRRCSLSRAKVSLANKATKYDMF